MKTLIFGGGCFWCTEAIFKYVSGVEDVVPGYIGGTTQNPTYEEVCTGKTGHAEAVKISYDETKTTLSELLKIFFKTHDPTTRNRQGNDTGTQYRSVIFYKNDNQKSIAHTSKIDAQSSGFFDNPIVTKINALDEFYPAENYHNDYYKNNPDAGYCALIIRPKLEKLNLE